MPMLVEKALLKCLGSKFREVAAFAIKEKDFRDSVSWGLGLHSVR